MNKKIKILLYIIIGLIILSIIIQLTQYKPKYKEVEKMKILRAGKIFNEKPKIDIIHQDCINGKIYFPSIKPDKMWIERINIDKPGKCYVRYNTKELCIFC